MGIVIRLIVSAVALGITAFILPGITLETDSTAKKVGTIVVVAAIFGVINAVLRPVIKTIGCWAYILTLGLVSLVVNGLLFLLSSWIAGKLDLPFHVDRFWPTAVLGALLVGVIAWVLNLVVPDKD